MLMELHIEKMRNTTKSYPSKTKTNKVIGHFEFAGTKVDFYDCYTTHNSRNYLILLEDQEKVKLLSKKVGNILEDIYKDNSDNIYLNAYIKQIFLTTNFENFIEVCFIINVSTAKIREIKLDLIINE